MIPTGWERQNIILHLYHGNCGFRLFKWGQRYFIFFQVRTEIIYVLSIVRSLNSYIFKLPLDYKIKKTLVHLHFVQWQHTLIFNRFVIYNPAIKEVLNIVNPFKELSNSVFHHSIMFLKCLLFGHTLKLKLIKVLNTPLT